MTVLSLLRHVRIFIHNDTTSLRTHLGHHEAMVPVLALGHPQRARIENHPTLVVAARTRVISLALTRLPSSEPLAAGVELLDFLGTLSASGAAGGMKLHVPLWTGDVWTGDTSRESLVRVWARH